MSDSKVFMFPEQGMSNGSLMSSLAPFLTQKGIDPNLLLMKGNNGLFGGEGSQFMWIIFLFFLMGWGGNGFGGFGRGGNAQVGAELGNLINNDNGRELLMSAIQGNGSAINQLASVVHCDHDNIQSALNSVMSQVQNVGNQVGMSGQQVINAIQAGNCQIGNQLAQCCCSVKDSITRQGYENQLSTANQTNALTQTMNANSLTLRDSGTANTNAILAKLDSMQTQSLYDKIDALRETKSTLQEQLMQQQQAAHFGSMISSAVAPINGSLSDLSTRLAKIECNQPEVAKVPYTPAMGGFIPVNYGVNVNPGCDCGAYHNC